MEMISNNDDDSKQFNTLLNESNSIEDDKQKDERDA